MNVFDYTFFIIYRFYRKKEKKLGPLGRAITYLSFLQFLLIYSGVFFLELILPSRLSPIDFLRSLNNVTYFFAVGLYVILDIFNQFRFRRKGKLQSILLKYSYLKSNRYVKAWHFLVLSFFLLILPPVLLGLFQ